MSKRYTKRKGKGGQINPKKKWTDLSLKQREWALQTAATAYIQARYELGRALNKQEKYSLIKKIKLRMWIPPEAVKPIFMDEFNRQENLIERDLEK
ncbi:hypothetical protein [Aneurinibacillus tyrosinisolvens]|uniref:hypothetical protein n=1 Tax=Aneurinibacillus tyrosinisolvens TaxID=1443435 RepID=UPI00063F91DF|nr:hypothetical protein [Aneurinibacillus tyrosinisolvens]